MTTQWTTLAAFDADCVVNNGIINYLTILHREHFQNLQLMLNISHGRAYVCNFFPPCKTSSVGLVFEALHRLLLNPYRDIELGDWQNIPCRVVMKKDSQENIALGHFKMDRFLTLEQFSALDHISDLPPLPKAEEFYYRRSKF